MSGSQPIPSIPTAATHEISYTLKLLTPYNHHHPNFSDLYQDLFRNTHISHLQFNFSPFQTTMKVHPAPHKRNITVRYDFAAQSTAAGSICCQKKLRRLSHIFGNDLDLPPWFKKRLNRLEGGG
ncbi:hypothetical protein HanIR_Chr03g0101441 [Helianthus annuus]|nr:hypothetical protein HanIR_Chr03g0101441 [Helianthus annuus]